MLGDQALLLEDVQSQSLLHWAQVWVRDSASLYHREKTKKLLGLTEREIVGQPGDLGMPLSLAALLLLVLMPHFLYGKPRHPRAPGLKSRFPIAIVSTKPLL